MERIFKPERYLSYSLLIVSFCAFTQVSCSDNDPAPAANAESFPSSVVTDWIDLQLLYAKESPGFTPPVVSRAFGYCGLAMYEAVVPGTPSNKSLVGQLANLDYLPTTDKTLEYHWGICANAAAAQITRTLFDNAPAPLLPKIDSLENVYAALWASVPTAVRDRSIAFGRVLADSVYGYSKTDGGHKGYNRNFPGSYVPPTGPGLWVPGPQIAMLPTWGNNRTFIKDLKTSIVHAGYPTYSTDPASTYYADAKAVHIASQSLSAEQETIAYYWADEGFVTFTPPGHSIAIYSQLVREGSFNLAMAAEGYVKMGIAVSDAFVYCWHLKFTFNRQRPSTFIRAAIDPSWIPLIPNPPFPEYTSGHSSQSGSAAKVLASIFGDQFAFTDLTHTKLSLGLSPRSYANFYAMADEASNSRLYAGIHFPSGNLEGKLTGYAIAQKVINLQYKK